MGRRSRRNLEKRTETVTIRLTPTERRAIDEFTELGDFEGMSEAGRALMLPYLEAMVSISEGASSFMAAIDAAKGMTKLNVYLAEVEKEHKRQQKEKEQGELGLGLAPV